ncbi:hypothetical protein AGMMS49992_08790 [Clostridia bacterium]|nr:hypothetical protein AGMMS49992_08790 [Clostridia bacterium]
MRLSTIWEAAKEIQVYGEVDVAVAGGGPAGVCAALAAARLGMRVVLIEQMGFLGGVNTAAGVNGIGGWQHDLDGRPLVAGIAQEIMVKLSEIEGSDPEVIRDVFRIREDRPTYREGGLGCYWIRSNPEMMKLLLDRMLRDAGVRVVLHAGAVAPIMTENKVSGLYMESKSGRQAVLAKVTIDCTGDGDIAARAGAPFELGRPQDGYCQPMSMIFTIGGGKEAELHYNPWEDQSHLPPLAKDRYRLAVRQARELGEIRYNPNDIFCAATPLNRKHSDTLSVNFTRIQRLNAVDADELTQAEMQGREQVFEGLRFMRKYIIGNENAYLISVPPMIGIRESRRILGDAYLTGDNIKTGKRWPDTIARAIYMIDTHNPTAIGEPSHLEYLDQPYDIPYGCLLPRGVERLLVAGRCISGDTIALSSFRILATCMNTGEAAGTAAALAVSGNTTPREIDIPLLQCTLTKQGAHISPAFELARQQSEQTEGV